MSLEPFSAPILPTLIVSCGVLLPPTSGITVVTVVVNASRCEKMGGGDVVVVFVAVVVTW
jgi:hypothetical protein